MGSFVRYYSCQASGKVQTLRDPDHRVRKQASLETRLATQDDVNGWRSCRGWDKLLSRTICLGYPSRDRTLLQQLHSLSTRIGKLLTSVPGSAEMIRLMNNSPRTPTHPRLDRFRTFTHPPRSLLEPLHYTLFWCSTATLVLLRSSVDHCTAYLQIHYTS